MDHFPVSFTLNLAVRLFRFHKECSWYFILIQNTVSLLQHRSIRNSFTCQNPYILCEWIQIELDFFFENVKIIGTNQCVQQGQLVNCMTKPQQMNHNQCPEYAKLYHSSLAIRYTSRWMCQHHFLHLELRLQTQFSERLYWNL